MWEDLQKMGVFRLFFVMCVFGLPRLLCAQTVCPKVGGSSCKCQTSEGLIDLTPLSNTVGARFSVQDPSGTSYTYNPCKGFTEGSCSGGTTVCQKSSATLGTIGTESITYDSTSVAIGYSYTPNQVQVNLKCDQSATTPTLTWNGGISTVYVFDLTSCQCCPGGCLTPTDPTGPTGTSAPPNSGASSAVAPGIIGIVLFVVMITAIVVYCVTGSIYMSKKRDAHGLDIIPNRTFWFEIPFLIWDGIKFTFSPCCNRSSGYKALK